MGANWAAWECDRIGEAIDGLPCDLTGEVVDWLDVEVALAFAVCWRIYLQ